VHETPEELADLQSLIDAGFARAGGLLTSIIAPERRLTAAESVAYLTGVKHLVVATTTSQGDPRVSAVDGLFLHGSFWFSTSRDALKARHLRARPAVSAAHVVGDDLAFFAHGHAELTAGGTPESAQLAPYWREVYDGSAPEEWTPTPEDAVYVRIVAHTFLTYCFNRSRYDELTTG